MAGGIDWYRAHHGTVADPKLGLVAAKAKARRGDVIAIWHMLLESASAAMDRGHAGAPDFEATDFLLGMDEGDARRIYEAMIDRGLLTSDGRIAKWEERQPKRERVEDKTAATRKQAQRERDSVADGEPGVTNDDKPCHAMSRHVTPRGEERREEGSVPTGTEAVASPSPSPEQPKSATELTRQELWSAGKSLLAEQGMAKAQCGTFVGKLVKDYGDEIVVEAVRVTVSQRPPDAASYLKATCMRMKGERQDAAPPGYADMTAKLDAESGRSTSAAPAVVEAVMSRVKAARAAMADAEAGNALQ